MAITRTLQQEVNLCSIHADLLPLSGVGGYTNEPALSLCNDALSDLVADPHDWTFNRIELPFFVTCPNKQDYQFGGACAFSLGSTSQGWAIGLASNSGVVTSGGVVTVNTLENHRFSVGDMVYMNGVTMTTGTSAKYNSVFTDNGSSSSWSGGFTLTTVGAKSFAFAAVTGQSNGDVGGAPGITNFGYGTSASMQEVNNNSSPPNQLPLTFKRELPVISRVALPEKVAVMADNGDGTLKIRMNFVPGGTTYAVNIVAQAQAPLKTSLTQTWAPFPDNLSAVYRQALMYRMYRYLESPKADREYLKLQDEVKKFQAGDDAAPTDVSLQPEESLMTNDSWGWQ